MPAILTCARKTNWRLHRQPDRRHQSASTLRMPDMGKVNFLPQTLKWLAEQAPNIDLRISAMQRRVRLSRALPRWRLAVSRVLKAWLFSPKVN
jgi:hypothetical protein